MKTLRLLFALLLVALLFSVPYAEADSFSYSVSATVISGNGTVGTLDGTFSLSTAGVPFNYAGTTYFCPGSGCPLVTSSDLVWTPTGSPSQTLQISDQVWTMVSPIEGFNGVETCTFALGASCEFQLATAGVQLIDFSGVLGQNLSMGLCADCLGSSYPNFGFVNYEGTVTDPDASAIVATDEPDTIVLIVAGVGLGIAIVGMVMLFRSLIRSYRDAFDDRGRED